VFGKISMHTTVRDAYPAELALWMTGQAQAVKQCEHVKTVEQDGGSGEWQWRNCTSLGRWDLSRENVIGKPEVMGGQRGSRWREEF
jgi:hypothetical protein